ncbi:MAG TPA: flavin reductase family protein, partial [Terriglobales bacterium]|nr:flavin reductase family protein [Terriglobales bacterium]
MLTRAVPFRHRAVTVRERWTTAPPKKYGKFDAGMSTNGMPLEGAGIEKQLFRQVCGRFACGITVITVKDEAGAVHGMTANSFTSVSLNPPLVLVCIDHRAKVLQHFRHSTHFGINVLSEH